MQIKKILLTSICCLFFSASFSQSKTSKISGKITDEDGLPIPGALVKIQDNSVSAVSDLEGMFVLEKLNAGNYTIFISSVGMAPQQKKLSVKDGEVLNLNFKLASNVQQLQTVNVIGRTETQEVNRQAYNVTAIDAKKLYNTTLDISGALDRVSGVRVRESGGVGSNFNISLNGFSGRHIRYFIDGIPMDNFGSSFQINNIPINIAERVEVYKGVVPIWLGSDALGGAVNIVTGNRHRNYVDASYSYGSFNTHRSVLNAAMTSKDGFTLQFNAFQNYSDNNFKTDLKLRLQNNMEPQLRATSVKRFHDTYHNETLIANIGVVDKPWADNLLVGVTLGKNYKEIQTAATPDAVFGQLHRRGNIIMPSIKYKKVNLFEGLDVTLNANYNLGYETTIDTAMADYDWDGIRDPKVSMGERDGGQHNEYRNNNGLATAMVSYKIDDRHSVAISNVFTTFDRKTSNLFYPENDAKDPAKIMNKNVLGFGYSYSIDSKWSVNFFGKYLVLKTIVEKANLDNLDQKLGYGSALSYYVSPNLQLRGSYELANRMPEANEIFGDLENQTENPLLKPEKSNNFNLGLIYNFKVNEDNRFSVSTNGFYRNSANFIFSRIKGGTGQDREKLVSENRDGVITTGVDGEIRYSFKNWLSAGATVTYQNLINQQRHDWDAGSGQYYTEESLVYLDRMPNIPFFFGNADVSGTFKNVLAKGNNLTIGYNLLYVNSFWLDWPSFGRPSADSKFGIPTQISHDANLVYSMKNGRYNVSLEVRNIADKAVYDNFALQKPGRGFYLNLRYFINKSQK